MPIGGPARGAKGPQIAGRLSRDLYAAADVVGSRYLTKFAGQQSIYRRFAPLPRARRYPGVRIQKCARRSMRGYEAVSSKPPKSGISAKIGRPNPRRRLRKDAELLPARVRREESTERPCAIGGSVPFREPVSTSTPTALGPLI